MCPVRSTHCPHQLPAIRFQDYLQRRSLHLSSGSTDHSDIAHVVRLCKHKYVFHDVSEHVVGARYISAGDAIFGRCRRSRFKFVRLTFIRMKDSENTRTADAIALAVRSVVRKRAQNWNNLRH